MATITGIRRDLAVQAGWTNPDTFSSATRNITSAASHAFGTRLNLAGSSGQIGDVVRVAGTSVSGDGRYDGDHVVLARTGTSVVIPVPFISNQTSGTVRTRVTQGEILESNENMTIGATTGNSQVIFDDPGHALVIDNQVLMYDNPDGSPGFLIGNDRSPTLLVDQNTNSDWSSGGTFTRAAAGEFPFIRMRRVNYIKAVRTRESGFGGNRQEIAVDADTCNFAWQGANTVPFMGTGGIWRNCTFTGAINQLLSTDHSFFLALPRVFTGCTIQRFGLGLKQEYGAAFYGQVEFTDCGVEAFTSRNLTRQSDATNGAGDTDGALNLVDSVFSTTLVAMSFDAIMRAWRTVRVSALQADGTAVSGATLYTMDGTTERRFSMSVNASANSAGYYQMENFTLNGQTTASGRPCRDVAYLFRPGDAVDISGFNTAANNGRKNVQGRLFGGTRYAHERLLDVTQAVTTEASRAVTIAISPPVSDANGVVPDHRILCFSAQARNFGNNGYGTGNNEPFTMANVLSNLTAIQAGTYRRGTQNVVHTDAFHRPNWKLVLIPPYPFAFQTTDIATPINTGGAPIEWLPVMANDEAVAVTVAATVAAYTSFANLQQMYDYLVWYKAQAANHSYPRHDLPIVRRTMTAVDFGALNVHFDEGATNPVARTATLLTLKPSSTFAAVTAFTEVRTTGAVTFASGTSLPVVVQDSSGRTGRLTITTNDVSGNVIGVFAPDGTQRGMLGTGTLTVALTAAQCVAGIKVVVARRGYRAQVRTVSMVGGGARTESFGALARLDLPDGTSMIAGASLSATISIAFSVSDISAVRCTVDIGNALVRVRPILFEVETALLTASGMKYLAFGGGQFLIDLSPTAGDSLYMPSTSRLRRAASGDANAGVIGNVFHPDDTPIDNSNGGVQIASGVSISTLAQSLFVDYDLDTGTPGVQSIAGRLAEILTAIGNIMGGGGGGLTPQQVTTLNTLVNSTHGLAALRTLILANKTELDGIEADVESSTHGLSALRTLILANKTELDGIEADVESSTHGLGALRTLILANKSELDGIEADVENSTHGLAAVATLITALPASVRDEVLDRDIGSTTVAKTLEAILAVVAGRTTVDEGARTARFGSLESTPTDRVQVDYDNDGVRTGGEVL